MEATVHCNEMQCNWEADGMTHPSQCCHTRCAANAFATFSRSYKMIKLNTSYNLFTYQVSMDKLQTVP